MTLNFRLAATLLAALLSLGACAQGGFNNSNGNLGGAGGLPGGIDATSPTYFTQTVGDRVLFPVDQSTLTPDAQAILNGQAQWLLSNPQYTAVIEGHADEQGTREYNLALGARRAASVRTYLIGRGVPESRLRTVSFGKERPLEVCSQESCYMRNRRAVTLLNIGA